MASGENWGTAISDTLRGTRSTGPKLRELERAKELAEAERTYELAKQALNAARKQKTELTAIEERRLLDDQAIRHQEALLGPARLKADLDLDVRGRTDDLDISKKRQETEIETESGLRTTNNQYDNVAKLVKLQGELGADARTAYMGENDATRAFIASQSAAARDFYKSMIPSFGQQLAQTAVNLIPLGLAALI